MYTPVGRTAWRLFLWKEKVRKRLCWHYLRWWAESTRSCEPVRVWYVILAAVLRTARAEILRIFLTSEPLSSCSLSSHVGFIISAVVSEDDRHTAGVTTSIGGTGWVQVHVEVLSGWMERDRSDAGTGMRWCWGTGASAVVRTVVLMVERRWMVGHRDLQTSSWYLVCKNWHFVIMDRTACLWLMTPINHRAVLT